MAVAVNNNMDLNRNEKFLEIIPLLIRPEEF